MTINYVKGDATRPQGPGIKIIVHCCNDVGAWGAGFVLALSARWPEPEQDYLTWYSTSRNTGKCLKNDLQLGTIWFTQVEPDIYVCNLIGQHQTIRCGGRSPIRYDAIDLGLTEVRRRIQVHKEADSISVHMPRMGAGLAGGDWRVIEALILKNLADHDIPVTVYDL